MNLVLSKSGAELVEGTPEYYVSDSDFADLLKDSEAAAKLYSEFGRRVCIGRLGKRGDDGIYYEGYAKAEISVDSGSQSSLGFYEKIK